MILVVSNLSFVSTLLFRLEPFCFAVTLVLFISTPSFGLKPVLLSLNLFVFDPTLLSLFDKNLFSFWINPIFYLQRVNCMPCNW